jgi:hypothetical protein
MVKEITKDRNLINRNYPFLKNFPFNQEFDMELSQPPVLAAMFDDEFEPISVPKVAQTINFRHKSTNSIKAVVAVNKNELIWLAEMAENITKLDKIAKRLDRGLKTKDLLLKRDISIEADEWLSQLGDGNTALSRETYNDALHSMVTNKSITQTVKIVNSINKLYSKKGLVKLAVEDRDVIFTFLHFRLVYAKLILGIVIASKISI